MPNSWGHTLTRMTDDEVKDNSVMWMDNQPHCQHWRAGRGCSNPPAFFTLYRYFTGRAGRTSRAQSAVCLEHARKFGNKYGIEVKP